MIFFGGTDRVVQPTVLGNSYLLSMGNVVPSMTLNLPYPITGRSSLSALNSDLRGYSSSGIFQTFTSLPASPLGSITTIGTYSSPLFEAQNSRSVVTVSNLVYNTIAINSTDPKTTLYFSTQQTYAERSLSWKDKLSSEVDDYSNRVAGWDGYGAIPIKPEAIRDARRFIKILPEDIRPPRDIPCSDGEVSLVWRHNGRYAEVSFPGNGTFYWYATNGQREQSGDDVPIEGGLPIQLQEMMEFGLITSSVPPIPEYSRALLQAA